jgi:hypothetical protein
MKLQIIYLIIEIESLSRTGGNTNSIMMPLGQDMFGMKGYNRFGNPLRLFISFRFLKGSDIEFR